MYLEKILIKVFFKSNPSQKQIEKKFCYVAAIVCRLVISVRLLLKERIMAVLNV